MCVSNQDKKKVQNPHSNIITEYNIHVQRIRALVIILRNSSYKLYFVFFLITRIGIVSINFIKSSFFLTIDQS